MLFSGQWNYTIYFSQLNAGEKKILLKIVCFVCTIKLYLSYVHQLLYFLKNITFGVHSGKHILILHTKQTNDLYIIPIISETVCFEFQVIYWINHTYNKRAFFLRFDSAQNTFKTDILTYTHLLMITLKQ